MLTAAVQFAPVFKEVAHNLHMAMKLIQQAAQEGAQLIVLPELCTTGYSFMSKAEAEPFAEVLQEGRSDIMVLAEPPKPNSPVSFTILRGIAKSLGVAIAWGLVEKDSGTDTLHNAQVLVLPEGQYVSYRKINLWGQDYIWAKSGTGSPPIVEYLGKKVGLLICRDVRDKAPAWDEFYEPGDADIVVLSTNWGDGSYPGVNWMKFATTNKTWLVVGNRYGQEANNDFGEGGPCVISPTGEVHCEGLQWSKPCIVYAETV